MTPVRKRAATAHYVITRIDESGEKMYLDIWTDNRGVAATWSSMDIHGTRLSKKDADAVAAVLKAKAQKCRTP